MTVFLAWTIVAAATLLTAANAARAGATGPAPPDYTVRVGGREIEVHSVPTRYNAPASFATCDVDGPVTIEVTADFLERGKINEISVHPLSLGIRPRREGPRVTFQVDRPRSLTLLVNGAHRVRPLHLFLFRFLKDIYNIPGDQSFPGGIRNVTIRNVSVILQEKGRRSVMEGWSADKPVRDVVIEDLRYGDEVIGDAKAMGLRSNAEVEDLRFHREQSGASGAMHDGLPFRQSLALVVPYLAGESKEEAAKAAIAIGESMVQSQPGAVAEAMQKVIANVKNDELAGKAKNVLERAKKAARSSP